MISTIIIVIICFSIIIHHLYKVKDELNDVKEKLNEISNYQTKYYEHLYNLLYQIDGCVEDIEDKTEDKRTKFICKTNDGDVELYDTEVLNIKPTIDKNGNAILIINYYDIEFCVNSTMYCKKVEIVNSEK